VGRGTALVDLADQPTAARSVGEADRWPIREASAGGS
jgi:hypothetical protein